MKTKRKNTNDNCKIRNKVFDRLGLTHTGKLLCSTAMTDVSNRPLARGNHSGVARCVKDARR